MIVLAISATAATATAGRGKVEILAHCLVFGKLFGREYGPCLVFSDLHGFLQRVLFFLYRSTVRLLNLVIRRFLLGRQQSQDLGIAL